MSGRSSIPAIGHLVAIPLWHRSLAFINLVVIGAIPEPSIASSISHTSQCLAAEMCQHLVCQFGNRCVPRRTTLINKAGLPIGINPRSHNVGNVFEFT